MVRSSLFAVMISILVLASNLIAAPATVVPLNVDQELQAMEHLDDLEDQAEVNKMITALQNFENILEDIKKNLLDVDRSEVALRKKFASVVKLGDVAEAEKIAASLTRMAGYRREYNNMLLEVKRNLRKIFEYTKLRQEQLKGKEK